LAEKSSTYFIPPELRKHVQLIKELPEIVADTVTDPDTYVALNELLNPVKWIESAGQKSGKFFESGGKDIESGAEALIETLGLAAGPMAQKYASTLAPMVSRGVGSGVKSLQELVMPLGATDDVAKKVPQKEGISRRDFIAGGTALGTLAGLKQAGDLLPTTKGAVKAAAKTPLASTIKALNSVKSNYKKVSNEQKLIEDSIFDLKSNPSKWVEDTYSAYKEHTPEELLELKKLEKLSDTTQMKVIKSVDSMEEKIGSLVSSLLKQSKKDLMKLNDDQLKSLRGHLTDNYYYSGFGTTKYVKFQPSDHFSIRKEPVDPKDFFKSDLADKTRMRKLTSSKESSEKTDYEKIVLRVDEVLEERGLTTIEDVNKLKERLLKNIRNMNYPGYKAFYNQGGLTTDEQTQQAFNKGGTTMEQQMSLFEEGGMKDDGLDRDPVSGNEIPPGSLAKEVRDDIPAQLSDGEYVVPADVVQYFGVKFFEDIRAEAKRGLAEMEATGRIGGEPVEVDMTMIAFGKAKEEEEKKKKAQGGVIHANDGVLTVDDDYFKQQAIAKANPTAGFGQVGQSIFGNTPTGNVPMPGTVLITKTFYHPDGRTQAVQGTMRGNPPVFVPNQGFDQFTKAPWSETPTAQKQATTQKKERDDNKDLEFISTESLANDPSFKGMNGVALRDAKGNIISMTKRDYGAVLTSANRLGIPMQEYHNLPLLSKAKLVGQEIKSAFGGEVDQDYIDEVVEGAKNNPENISILERFLNFITGGKSKKTEDTGTTPTGGANGGNQNQKPNMENISKRNKEKGRVEDLTGTTGKNMSASDREAAVEKYESLPQSKQQTIQKVQSETQRKIDEGKATGNYKGLNKGGLLKKPKPKTRKPRGKGLGNKK
jgi:hypothetical protein